MPNQTSGGVQYFRESTEFVAKILYWPERKGSGPSANEIIGEIRNVCDFRIKKRHSDCLPLVTTADYDPGRVAMRSNTLTRFGHPSHPHTALQLTCDAPNPQTAHLSLGP